MCQEFHLTVKENQCPAYRETYRTVCVSMTNELGCRNKGRSHHSYRNLHCPASQRHLKTKHRYIRNTNTHTLDRFRDLFWGRTNHWNWNNVMDFWCFLYISIHFCRMGQSILLWKDKSPKKRNSVIINSPSYHLNPVKLSFIEINNTICFFDLHN